MGSVVRRVQRRKRSLGEVRVLRREDFQRRLQEAPTIALGLLRELSRRCGRAASIPGPRARRR